MKAKVNVRRSGFRVRSHTRARRQPERLRLLDYVVTSPHSTLRHIVKFATYTIRLLR